METIIYMSTYIYILYLIAHVYKFLKEDDTFSFFFFFQGLPVPGKIHAEMLEFVADCVGISQTWKVCIYIDRTSTRLG